MNILIVIVLLYVSLYFVLPLLVEDIFNNFTELQNILYLSLFILINLIIFNIIFNIFKKNKDSLFLIITKNVKNTFLILTFLLILIDLDFYDNNKNLQILFIVLPLILKSFILSLFLEY
jgi:hypothetical protein